MPDEQSVEQLEARLGELVAERNELLQETSALEEVSQTNAAVKELRQVLDATGGDAEAVKEKLDEYVEGLDNLGAEIREALEDPAVRELTEGVGEGLEQFTEALENVNEALGPLEETLDQIQNALENAGAPADQQIEALAEAFEFAVDKLGPLIERIPGLGAFFKIYAKAIKHIAVSVGQIQATQRDLQKGWSRLDPGTTMYMVARNEHEIHQGAILELELQIEQTTAQLLERYQAQREEIPDDVAHEVDVLVRSAERHCGPQRPRTDAPELQARNAAWRELEAANERRSLALGNYYGAAEEADRAAIAAEVAASRGERVNLSELATLRDRADSSARAGDRAAQTLRQRQNEQAAAQSAFETAKAPWDAIRQAYIDCVKSRITEMGRFANTGSGLTDSDLRYLEVMYPQYAGPPSEVDEMPATEPTKVSSAAGFPRRLVIGGGGILAVLAVGPVFVIGGGGDDDLAATPTPLVGGGGGTAATSTVEPTAAATVAPTAVVPTPAPTPGEGYTFCNIHPDENALYCRPYYAQLTSTSRVLITPGFPPYQVESTHVMREPIPTTPERPLEYRFAVEGASGQRIEHVLSASAGEPLTCRRLEDGVEAAVPAGDVCGQITGPETIFFSIDVTRFAPGSVAWVFSTLETEDDGIRRGTYSASSGEPVSLPAP